jgi:hypothetical protein
LGRAGMLLLQWTALGVLLLAIVGLTWLFVRKGMTIKPDPDGKHRSDYGGGF